MILHKDLEQGSPEWLEVRLGRLTASNAQAIATNGKGLETLCFNAVAEILTGKPISDYTNPHMENGNEQEANARQVYELSTGFTTEQVGFASIGEHVGASPDGLVGDDGLVEIKCPTARVFTEYLYTKKVDPKYYAQMQMQMYVLERQWCDYVVYNQNFTPAYIVQRVERDEKVIDKIVVGLNTGEDKINEILNKIRL
jgi:putative phage-type endonuclease